MQHLAFLMDPFYAFILFALVLVLEQTAGRAWLPGYYRFGIPIARYRRNLTIHFDAINAARNLEPAFRKQPSLPSIQFKALGDRQVAFREAMFENRGGIRYLPVIHSILRLHPEQGALTVTGYVNGYILIALVYLVYRVLVERSFIPVGVLILLIFAYSYAVQTSINRRVAEAAANTRNYFMTE